MAGVENNMEGVIIMSYFTRKTAVLLSGGLVLFTAAGITHAVDKATPLLAQPSASAHKVRPAGSDQGGELVHKVKPGSAEEAANKATPKLMQQNLQGKGWEMHKAGPGAAGVPPSPASGKSEPKSQDLKAMRKRPGRVKADPGFNPAPPPPTMDGKGGKLMQQPGAKRGFNPQPEPPPEHKASGFVKPGEKYGFNPQPEPPAMQQHQGINSPGGNVSEETPAEGEDPMQGMPNPAQNQGGFSQ
jgi:hypothetical protein